ncbi:MAG: hypothetical protein ACK4VI_07165 [Alphaproteobacteria bacterium]
MDTKLSTTGSKYISETPLYPGDLINNTALYWPRPDFTDPMWKMLQMNAEGFTQDSSRAHAFHKKAMMYCSISGGFKGYELAEQYPHKILEGSRRFIEAGDHEFMTIQRLQEVLGSRLMAPEVFARNGLLNQTATEFAARNMPQFYVAGPDDREGHLRALHQIHAMMRGAGYQDATFEMGIWGPECLLEFDRGIYFGDHAWSRNACPEKAVALAVQYGARLPLDAREGASYDIVDIHARPVSIVDQAWEDARHLVDVVERGFRSEPSAALLAARFMYDELWRSNAPLLSQKYAADQVKSHYASPAEIEKMDKLKAVMMPYLAERCNWPTLGKILNNDTHLKGFWEEHIAPSRAKLLQIPEVETFILPYLPRGGFESQQLKLKVEQRADPQQKRVAFSLAHTPARPLGLHEHPFDTAFDPKLFNDRNFARLGGTKNPDHTPDNDHLTFDQAASIMIVNAMRKARRPVQGAKTYLMLDDADSGLMAAAFDEKHNISDQRSAKTAFDPLAKGSQTFAMEVAADHSFQIENGIYTLMGKSPKFQDWRAQNDLGNIVTVSDFRKAGAKYKNRRGALDAEMRQGISADGPIEMSAAGIETCVRRFATLAADGIILKPGKINALEARIIGDAVLSAVGLVDKPHEGGKFKCDFYMWHDYLEDPLTQEPPQRLDLGDLILHLGIQIKANLESKNPAPMPEHNITLARLLEVYEMLVDSGRRNMITTRDPKSGKDHQEQIIDWTQVAPDFILDLIENEPGGVNLGDLDIHRIGDNPVLDKFLQDPEFIAFGKAEKTKTADDYAPYAQDPVQKAKLVRMMWGWMRAVPMFTKPDAKSAATPLPVTGHLTTKGMMGIDDFSLRDLHEDYRAGRDAMENLTAKARKNVFGSGVIHLDNTPSISVA